MMEHRANQTAAPFEALVLAMRTLANYKAKFAKLKVSSFVFFRFRYLRKVNFADLAFFDFSIRLMRPRLAGGSDGVSRQKNNRGSRSDSLPFMPKQPCTSRPFTPNLPGCT